MQIYKCFVLLLLSRAPRSLKYPHGWYSTRKVLKMAFSHCSLCWSNVSMLHYKAYCKCSVCPAKSYKFIRYMNSKVRFLLMQAVIYNMADENYGKWEYKFCLLWKESLTHPLQCWRLGYYCQFSPHFLLHQVFCLRVCENPSCSLFRNTWLPELLMSHCPCNHKTRRWKTFGAKATYQGAKKK